jgi:hypothetical protein
MSERKAVTLVGIAVVLLSTGAWIAVVALGGGGYLATAAMIVVMGLGLDQVSKLIMSFDRH